MVWPQADPPLLSPWHLAEDTLPDLYSYKIGLNSPLSPGWLDPLQEDFNLFLSLCFARFWTSRAVSPPTVQERHPQFLSQTNKRMPLGQTRRQGGHRRSSGVGVGRALASVVRNGCLPPLCFCGPSLIFLSGDPKGGLGRKQFAEERSPHPHPRPSPGCKEPSVLLLPPMHSRWSKELKRQQQFFKTSHRRKWN